MDRRIALEAVAAVGVFLLGVGYGTLYPRPAPEPEVKVVEKTVEKRVVFDTAAIAERLKLLGLKVITGERAEAWDERCGATTFAWQMMVRADHGDESVVEWLTLCVLPNGRFTIIY